MSGEIKSAKLYFYLPMVQKSALTRHSLNTADGSMQLGPNTGCGIAGLASVILEDVLLRRNIPGPLTHLAASTWCPQSGSLKRYTREHKFHNLVV